MKKIQLIIGTKGSGKSSRIEQEYKRLAPFYKEIDVINPSDFNTIIHVLENQVTKELIILNSGSDMKCIIENFGDIMKKYHNASEVYTAIRPIGSNRNLHIWMMRALNIASNDIMLPEIILP